MSENKPGKARLWGIIAGAAAVIAAVVLAITVVLPAVRYNGAVKLINEGQYDKAAAAFAGLGDYKDSAPP